MRFLLPGLLLLCSIHVLAQEGKDLYFIQQAPPQQMALDCYQRCLDEGSRAKARGDCRVALRWFLEAQSCPELLKSPERQEELNKLIAQCSEHKTAAAETSKRAASASSPQARQTTLAKTSPQQRRRFQPSREFLRFDQPDCFEITCKEAARAFREKCWDDAAALYRAAKNCSDADQADRMTANAQINACRLASQNELLQKEQDAVRQARHALAANRANDARLLLRNYDRSLAYRLADFANEYIAPEDNDACRQTMFDALYYTPSAHAGPGNEQLQIPFCYQLGDNLDPDLQICFLGRKRSQKICGFARSRHLLFQWDANSFEPQTPIQLEDTTLLYIDAVPDGRTLLFLSQDAYLFWRSPREIFRLPVRLVSNYCFSADGRSFFFLDPYEGQVYSLDLSAAFATRKGYSQRATPEPTGIYAYPGILNIAGGNGQFWLGYPDSIVVYRSEGASGRLWAPEQTIQLGYRSPNYFSGQPPFLWLDPLARTAIFTNDTSMVFFQIPENKDGPVPASRFLAGSGLAVGAGSALVAGYQLNLMGTTNTLFLYSPEDGIIRYKTPIPNGRIISSLLTRGGRASSNLRTPATGQGELNLRYGTFSPENRLFATTTISGKLEVWVLSEDSNQENRSFEDSRFVAPNADGSKLFIWRNDSILLVSANQPDQILEAGPAPDNAEIPGLLAAQNWLAYRSGSDALVLTNELSRQRFTLVSPRDGLEEIMGAFSPNEQQFACLAESDSVAVYELSGGRAIAGRKFGGPILQIYYVPQTDEILVVHLVESDNLDQEQTVIKLWDPNKEPTVPMRTVRLQGYDNQEVAFSNAQDYIAFTNGLDIRVFRQTDLLDESIRIRQNGNHMVMALEFHPDGSMLAAGYEDGSVVFWDTNTGQARFSWSAPAGMDPLAPNAVARLRFTEQGRRLQILFNNSQLLTRDLEVSRIRAGVQTDFKKLISFQPGEIREYDLEQAFEYPNNFARLAASGDLPLIRSFFDYFRETAQFSNNVERVGNSCQRAADLFGQLDAGTQTVLRPILLEMFEDYHWKLLLRNQTDLAQKVAEVMQRDFGKPVAAVLAFAHTALLQGDERTAAQQYAEWAFRSAEVNAGHINPYSLDSLHTKIIQLLEYNLIQPDQMDCICSLFGSLPPFDQRCATVAAPPSATLLNAESALRWRIFQQMNRAQFSENNREKVQLLEAALADTRLLQNQRFSGYQTALENVVLALSLAYADWGLFEQGHGAALQYYQKALDYLNANGPFPSAAREQLRLASVASNYMSLGDLYQGRDQLLLAVNSYRQGIVETDRLLRQLEGNATRMQRFQDELRGPLETQLGYTFLLQGNADAALQAFEQAQNDRAEGIHRLYFGHAALLADNEIEALIEYGNILTDESLGKALFDIEQMAAHLPVHSSRLLDFLQRMRSARLETRQQMDSTATDYYWAYYKILAFGAQQKWDLALKWSEVATDLAQQLFDRQPNERAWQNNWLDGLLNQSFYLLFASVQDTANLSRAIRVSEEAQNYFDRSGDFIYYANKALIQTNLAHAYWLRQQAGDREQAIRIYKEFLASPLEIYDPWELLLKDFRDLRQAGVQWPDFEDLIREIQPEGAASE